MSEKGAEEREREKPSTLAGMRALIIWARTTRRTRTDSDGFRATAALKMGQ